MELEKSIKVKILTFFSLVVATIIIRHHQDLVIYYFCTI
jgi:hypothetical protein